MALTDDSGFVLHYDDDVSEEERRFYNKVYQSVDQVIKRKIHCTVCDDHIGTAPCQESLIRMHPILKVTHCKKCHDFYNSGEFSKGEDGSELYCRWCGQGGEVYCCSKCPYVFCKNCIILNLSQNVVTDIEENENWNCFVCAPKIMWHLRAQHWALMNFIEKQKKMISSKNLSESEVRKLMAHDKSTCCGVKTVPPSLKRLSNTKTLPGGEIGNASDASGDSEIPSSQKRKLDKKFRKILPKTQMDSESGDERSPQAKKHKSNNDEVVCTPDVLSMLGTGNSSLNTPKKNDTQSSKQQQMQSKAQQKNVSSQQKSKILSTQPSRPTQSAQTVSAVRQAVMSMQQQQHQHASTAAQTHLQQPPPLIIRNYSGAMRPITPTVVTRKTVVGPRPPSSAPNQTPVYHTIGGFRIDLNSAAQQETFRLPNGKLIQVKRQGTVPSSTNVSSSSAMQQQNMTTINGNQLIRTQINSRQPGTQAIITQGNQQVQHISLQSPQLATIRYTRPSQSTAGSAGATTITTIPTQGGTVILNGTTVQQVAAATAATTVRPVASTTPGITRRLFSATPLGQARSQLQNQILLANEICQYLTGKIVSLTNSTAYNSVKNYTDVKDLYIHLSYLFTYAIGRFKSVQDKCLEEMRKIGFAEDAASLQSGQLASEKNTNGGDDDDIEIVEPKTTCIDLDSDNEDDSKSTKILAVGDKTQKTTSKQVSSTTVSLSPNASFLESNPSDTTFNDLEITANLLAGMLDVELHEENNDEMLSKANSPASSINSGSGNNGPRQPRKKMTNKPNPLLKQMELQELERNKEMIQSDTKLKSECSVVLEKLDESNDKLKELKENQDEKDEIEKEEEGECQNKNNDDNDKIDIADNESNHSSSMSIKDNIKEDDDDDLKKDERKEINDDDLKKDERKEINDDDLKKDEEKEINDDNLKKDEGKEINDDSLKEKNEKSLDDNLKNDEEKEINDDSLKEKNEKSLDEKENKHNEETEVNDDQISNNTYENINVNEDEDMKECKNEPSPTVDNKEKETLEENLKLRNTNLELDNVNSVENTVTDNNSEEEMKDISDEVKEDDNTASENIFLRDQDPIMQEDNNSCSNDMVHSDNMMIDNENENQNDEQDDEIDKIVNSAAAKINGECEQESSIENQQIQSNEENKMDEQNDSLKSFDCIDESSKTQDSLFESISDTTLLDTLSNTGADNFLADFSLDGMVVDSTNIVNNNDGN